MTPPDTSVSARLSTRAVWWRTGGGLLLVLMAVALYAPVLHAPFQFDDYDFILNNPSIRDVSDVTAIWNNLSQPSRFIPFYTFALNYHFHGYDPFGYHVVNLIVHIVCALLVWGIAAHAAARCGLKSAVRHVHPEVFGWIAAAVFIAHPVQTQAVTYISQRFASLAALFYLAALLAYIFGREAVREGRRRRAAGFFILSAGAAILGMFSKEFVMTLPLIIILYEVGFIQRKMSFSWRRWGAWALGLFPVMLIVPAIFSFRPEVLFGPRASSSHHGDIITLPGYLLTQLRVFVKFLQLLVFPVSQNLEYDFALSRTLFDPAVLGSTGVLAAVLALGMIAWRGHRLVSFAVLWFFLSLSSHLVPRPYVIAEHKLYIASVGLCILIAYVVAVMIRGRDRRIAALAVILTTLSVLCWQRNQLWRDPVALWTDTARKSPEKPRAWLFLGLAHAEKGEFPQALEAYGRALRLDPTLARAYHNRGKVYSQMKDYPAALADYNAALRYNTKLADVYNNRGNILRHMREYRRALDDYAEAIRLNPDYPQAYNNRGIVYRKLKDFDRAVEDFSTAIRLDPQYAVVYNNRGNLYIQQGKAELALKDYTRAIELAGGRPLTAETRDQLAVTHLNRALYFARRRQFDQAYEDALSAQRLGYAGAQKYVRMWAPLAAED